MRRALALAALLALPPAAADTAFLFDWARDAAGGEALQLGAAYVGPQFGWHFEIAHSRADGGPRAEFTGDDFAFGASATTGAWTWSVDSEFWLDSSGTDATLWTLGAAHKGERWRVGLEYADGKIETSLPQVTASDLVRHDYSRRGGRLLFSLRGEHWNFWGDAADWHYEPDLAASTDALLLELEGLVNLTTLVVLVRNGDAALVDAYLGANGLPELQQVLANQGLAGMVRVLRYQQRRVAYALALHGFALGLSDPTARLGIEREFGDSALSLEYELLEIPVDGLSAQSLALAWRVPLSDAVDLTLEFGTLDTEDYGSTEFFGLNLMYYFR